MTVLRIWIISRLRITPANSDHALDDEAKPVEVQNDHQEIQEDRDGSTDSSVPGLDVPSPHRVQDQAIPAEWEHNDSEHKVAQEKYGVVNGW